MLQLLENLDIRITLFLNSMHCGFADGIMMWCTNGMNWLPLYFFLLALLVKYYGRQTLLILLFTAILITLTDQISSNLFKNLFMRIRPCSDPRIKDLVHIVNDYRSGSYSFTSSHAANFFGIAVFFSGLLGKKIRHFSPAILILAGFIGYTRIYLGVHFFGDVIAGALMGSFIGFLMQLLYKYLSRSVLLKSSFFKTPDN